jgi:pimeloyl-ACP methyl ester carboxylesterase
MRLANVIASGWCGPARAAAMVVLAFSAPALAGEPEDGPVVRAGSDELRFAGPYRAGRVPVVLVHGLLGSPANWSGMIEQLSSDPTIRDHFQLLTFRYDSFRSIPDTGRGLLAALGQARRRLDPEGRDPALDRVILVGHSLGGLIAKAATRAPDPMPQGIADPPSDGIVQSLTPRVGRAIFIATPHRGSPVDRGAVRSAGHWLARGLGHPSETRGSRVTSIDQLTWDHPLLAELERTRATDGAPFHSIIAALRDPAEEGATDGLVPVASARLGGARSEAVVRAHHLCLQHPDVIREVRRILLEHATSPTLAVRMAPSELGILRPSPQEISDP